MSRWFGLLLFCSAWGEDLIIPNALVSGLDTRAESFKCIRNLTQDTLCSEGFYFSSGICLECPAGQYCFGNVSAPRKCPPGTHNLHPGKSGIQDCQPCAPGLISREDGVDCRLCPAGFSCDRAAGTLTACRNGLHSPEGHTQCLDCPLGYVCLDGFQKRCGPGEEPNPNQTKCTECPEGFYATLCSARCEPCPAGSYCPHSGMSQPLLCPLGWYTDVAGQSSCKSCNGSAACKCEGTQSRTEMQLSQRYILPIPCPPGTHRDGKGSGCDLCPLGHYCAGGVAIQCPAGTYGPKEGLQRERDCAICPAGFYCLEGTSRRPSSQFLCPQGYYCEEGTAVPHGSPCPAGTAGGQLGQTSRAACKRCAEGRYCPAGSAGPGLLCARGRYCPAGTDIEIVCPRGTFTPHQGALSVKDCLKCPVGFYCPEGTSDPLPCQPGTFNPLEGQDALSDCRPCYPGKACTQVALKSPDVDCMPGYVCPPGSARPNDPANACPPGTLSNRTDLTDRSQCQLCPARYACLRGTGGIQRPPLSCFAGHYCPIGTMFPTQHKCPTGTWNERSGLESERECRPCPQGWYCLAGVGVPSGRCSSGHYCPEGTMYGTQFPCPRGTYSTKMGNGGKEDCLVCPEGFFCSEGSSKPIPCPPKTFRQFKGGQRPEDCAVCPAGYFCPQSATISPRVCGTGSYSDEGSAECLPCLPGHYCSEETTSAEAMLRVMVCPPGFLCYKGLDREPQRSAILCPIGFYCPGGGVNPNPIPCPNGTYSQKPGLRDRSDCTLCPVGMFCFSQQPKEHPITEPTGGCPDGYHCPPGTGHPLSFPCESGFFRNESHGHGGGTCVKCPASYYCATVATHTPSLCPEGFFCPEGSSTPLPCKEGTYSARPGLHGASECTPCDGGRYCTGVGRRKPSGDCDGGFYCRKASSRATPLDGQTGDVCPAGSFCPPGSAHPQPCPPGTFSNSTGLRYAQQCVGCPEGYYCLGLGCTSPTGLCSAGYYCTGGSASPIQHQTEEGHYSLEGAVRPEPCSLGTFQPERGQSSCLQCKPGKLCNQTALSDQPLCPAGHYCPAGTLTAHPCPPGTYMANPGAEKVQHCGPCDAGQYCHSPGLSGPQGPCEPGFYCSGGANTATPVNFRSGDVCPAGFYCPEGTRHPHQYPCPAGTWSNVMGAQNLSSCLLCPAGFFCNRTGLTQPTGACAAGFFCVGGATTSKPVDGVTGNRCPAGYYCPQGCSLPQHCPDGTYSNTTGAAECSDCPPGWLCLEGEDVQLCPEGHYCLGGTVEDILPCPPGTYNPKAGQRQIEQCSLCSAGMYCEEWGLVEPTGPCQSGYFCLAGTNFRNPDGNFSTGVGGACPAGHFCPEGTSHPLPCPPGTFSSSLYITRSSDCSWCPPGQFCGSAGLHKPSGPCLQGFHCPGGASSPTGVGTEGGLCPQAHYCPIGSAMPLPCPAGTFTNLAGQTKCSLCHAGYYCPESTSNYTEFPCPPGFYCPDGTRHATQFPCPRGYYNPESLTQSLDSCLPCLPGHYCEKERLTAVSGKCKAGWFCVSAAWNPQPFDLDNYTNANCLCPASSTGGRCQAGYYCPSGSSEPLPCPPGAFCNATGLALPSGPCAPGYYCTKEAAEYKPTDGITGDLCPPGSYCPEGSGKPEPCPVGTFSPAAGKHRASQCRPCTAGLYCSSRGLRAPTGLCSEGYWCPPGQTGDLALPCPLGHHCPPGSPAPVLCPSGTYQNKQKQANCTVCEEGFYCDESYGVTNVSVLQLCPKGHYCPKGTLYATQFPCPAGTYNPRDGTHSHTSCLPCPFGHFCPSLGLAEPAGLCIAGYWCREGSHSASPSAGPSGSPCPVGHYCPKGTTSPTPCPSGTWSNSTGQRSEEECHPCPGGSYCTGAALTVPTGLCSEGFYCLEKAMTPVPLDGISGNVCPQGHYCPSGTAQPVPCDPGTFMPATQAAQCWSCPAGWYCVSGNRFPCPKGFYCPEGTGYDWSACPSGTYSPDSGLKALSQCRECDGGHFCSHQNATSVSGRCSAGYYCSRRNISPQPATPSAGDGGPCPAGHFCPKGTTDPQPCPEGTFSNRSKLASEDECLPCSPGHYCDTPGLPAPKGECWEGFYCRQAALLPNPPVRDGRGGPCPAGSFCPRGSVVPQVCPQGSISHSDGQASCTLCPYGYYCPANGSFSESKSCPMGHYCPVGTSLKYQHPCPAGTLNPYTLMGSVEDCKPCTPGFFCRALGQSAVSGLCAEGYFCISGAVTPTPEDGVTGDLCPPGHYCPAGSSSPRPCPPGHYSNRTMNTELSACLPCPAGFACSSRGLSSPSHVCQAGHYCPQGQNSSQPAQYTCSPGHMCPSGSAAPNPCPPGTYQSLHRQAECLLCPPGFFCEGEVDITTGIMGGTRMPLSCPVGHYCSKGTKSWREFPCPAGTYSSDFGLASMEECVPCPAGKYCSSSGLSVPSGDCSPGYVCIQGASQPQPSSDDTGRKCPEGFYCPAGTSHVQPCPPGTFSSLEGAASLVACQPCPPGQYCGVYGLSSPSGPCSPGYYCTLSSSSSTPHYNGSHDVDHEETAGHELFTGNICPKGHYCPIGSAHPKPCPPGSFLGRSGAASESDCDPCTPGSYCPNWAQGSVELLCPEGWFCPAGSATARQQCPPSHACPYGSVKPTICSPGTYQAQAAQAFCQVCQPGFYCQEGASMPMPCPEGTVSQIEGLQSKLDCFLCPPGFYCNRSALTSPSGPCSAGHFCLSGATESKPVLQTYGDICPAGHYCPEHSSSPLPCPVGYFLPDKEASSLSFCHPCPPGWYCHALGASQASGLCSRGHYCTGRAKTATPQAKAKQFRCLCDFLPKSRHSEYSLCAQSYNVSCPAHAPGGVGVCRGRDGRTSPGSALTEFLSECTNFTGDICPTGFYCPTGTSLPQPCDAGFYCNQTGLQAPVGTCMAGFYCPKGSTDPYGTPCPAGHYCPRTTALPLPCPPGTLRSAVGAFSINDCLQCPSGYFCAWRGLTEPSGLCSGGYYCPAGQNSSQPAEHKCRAGHFCETGSINESPCPRGGYQPKEREWTCELCPAGFSCPEEGLTRPVLCKSGFYCPAQTVTEKPCPAGTYGNQSGFADSSECSPCDPGTYCAGEGNTSPSGPCMAGFLCFGGSSLPSPTDNVSGTRCPPGFYCLTGSLTATPCPKGTYSVQHGLTELGQCQKCSPGFYCSETGLTAVSGPCLAGFYCSEGSSSAAPLSTVFGSLCPPGHYCESGSAVPSPCPVGTCRSESGGMRVEDCMPCAGGLFQDQRGQRMCKPCPPGFHCPTFTQQSNVSTTPMICPEGYYCPAETLLARPVPCPKGTYSNTPGLVSADQCVPCPLGYFCGAYALVQPSGTCGSGFLCFMQATVPNPTDNITGGLCPPGAYCQLGVRTGDCSPGYYCDWGSSSPEQRLCPAGFYCPAGTDKPIRCRPGMFSLVLGNSDIKNCEPCPAGYYCQGDGVVEPAICPLGFYCPTGTSLGTEFPCPQGTLQPLPGASSEKDCSPCPPGMFCALAGLSEPTGYCQDGYYCPLGAIRPNATGDRVDSAGNKMCPPGHYCPPGTGYPIPCPPGTFSNLAGLNEVRQCQPCPPGYFCEHPAMANPSEASLCDAGYVCLGGSRSARPIDGLEGYLCPSGYSCSIGTPKEVPCDPGSFSSVPGATHCLLCPAGTQCPSSATREPLPCHKGHFCPAGSAIASPCPIGTLSQVERAQSESACVPCPSGFFCSIPGSSEPQGLCQAGYFCQSGSVYPAPLNSSGFLTNGLCPKGHFCPLGTNTPLPCPAGTIRNITGGVSMDSCLPCPAGHYCASEGLDSPSGPCATGFYCPANFFSTTPYAFLCLKGYYCPLGSPMALPCPKGQYQPNPGSDSCIPCHSGFYCEESIAGDPSLCPSHSYCPEATEIPLPCPNGTYTPPDVKGLQDERDCLACPPGRFCRGGQIRGLCAAGYVCISGSTEFMPRGSAVPITGQCEWGVQCAGPCPAGFYCPEGTEQPEACPANTLREITGGRSPQDCLLCPPAYWCKKSDPQLYLCPVGHYCDGIIDFNSEGRPGPKKCPLFTYRPTPGAGSKGDCFQCPAGTFCNATGLTNFSGFACPPGSWCSGTGPPVPCPAGTMRAQPGATSTSQCQPCAAGTYCPDPRLTGQPNSQGIPCRASYQCPTGTVMEILCSAGSYCRPQTGDPISCPAGYYCPEGSHTYNTPQQVCAYPYYCPTNSSTMLSCGGGFMPRNISGFRVSHESCCILCEAGTYRPSGSPHQRCLACPPGYLCPRGTLHYSDQPCPLGYFCPYGSSNPIPCPPGTYGNHTKAELLKECHHCPPGTFNHLYAQRACFPCGSSSKSVRGASSCSCIGKNRAFQHSDGSCVCRTGYVFYDELDFKSSSSDSHLDCQPEVTKRCGTGQVRLASSQECVSPSEHSCNITCGPHGGSLEVGLGICHCMKFVSAEELCNTSCVSALPLLFARRAPDGQLVLRNKAMDDSRNWSRNIMNVLGPDSHISNTGKTHFVQFSPEGVFGWILKDPVHLETLLSVGHQRKRRHTSEAELPSPGSLPRIPNPIACLSANDMLFFQLTINYTDRLLSNFPVYQKNHLFSSNPAWDFGAFRRLQHLIKHSQLNSSRFAHVFLEPGNYVFLDNAVPDWSLIVVVRDEGTECDPAAVAFQPTSPDQLVRHGVVKQQRINLLPDWGTIIWILVLTVLLIIVLTISALFLKPNRASLIDKNRTKPKWHSLGEPRVYNGDCMESTGLLGLRGMAEGAEEEPAVSKGPGNGLIDLEEFNVKTLYDKLEDQNLHLASQLAKHRKATQEFYRNICEQTDALQDTLENMEPSKLIQWKKIIESKAEASKKSLGVEPWMGMMETLLKSLEAVLCRLNREAGQQQHRTSATGHRDIRESEIHTQIFSADTSDPKARPDTEAAFSDPVPILSTAGCMSEEDLAQLVALTPLSKTLEDIQQSLQDLSSSRSTAREPQTMPSEPIERQPEHLIPVALDNLSLGHFAVFMFGCHVLRLLNQACSFPSVMLLLAKELPDKISDSPLPFCYKEFYYDTSNQILYILESKLQDAGQFISVLLHSVAYISSDSDPKAFSRALHLAISALSMHLFHLSYSQEEQKCKINETQSQTFGTLVEEFLSAKVPPETQFTQTLLTERLEKYKYFNLEHLLQELKTSPANRPTQSLGPVSPNIPVQDNVLTSKLQQQTVEQRLTEMRMSKLHAAQTIEKHEGSQTPATERDQDSRSASKHTISRTDNQDPIADPVPQPDTVL